MVVVNLVADAGAITAGVLRESSRNSRSKDIATVTAPRINGPAGLLSETLATAGDQTRGCVDPLLHQPDTPTTVTSRADMHLLLSRLALPCGAPVTQVADFCFRSFVVSGLSANGPSRVCAYCEFDGGIDILHCCVEVCSGEGKGGNDE